jgi:hypothetical protein
MNRPILALLLLGSFLGGRPLSADVDDCNDYLTRHYRRDLKPISVSFRRLAWSVLPVTALRVTVKNVGEVAVGERGVPRAIRVRLGALVMKGSFSGTIEPGATRAIDLGVSKMGRFSHCGARTVRIDTTRTAGQWGCNCFTNDEAVVRTYELGNRRLCLSFGPGSAEGAFQEAR